MSFVKIFFRDGWHYPTESEQIYMRLVLQALNQAPRNKLRMLDLKEACQGLAPEGFRIHGTQLSKIVYLMNGLKKKLLKSSISDELLKLSLLFPRISIEKGYIT